MGVATVPKRRTETVSFRLDSNVREAMEEEARRSGVSLNSLVSQIFLGYSGWGRYSERLKLIPVSKDLLREVFRSMDRDEVRKIAQSQAIAGGSEHILFLFQEISMDNVLRFIDIWRSHFDASQHRYDGKKHYYTIHHDVNLEFSQFVREFLNSLIQSTVPRPVHFETVSPNSITFSFAA